jgi:hypothetical protein
MSLPGASTLSKPYKRDADTRRVSDLLDTLIAIRIDVGHSANGVAASPTLGSEQMREVRALLDQAIASAKEIFGSVYRSQSSDQVGPSRHTRRVTLRCMAGVDRTPS